MGVGDGGCRVVWEVAQFGTKIQSRTPSGRISIKSLYRHSHPAPILCNTPTPTAHRLPLPLKMTVSLTYYSYQWMCGCVWGGGNHSQAGLGGGNGTNTAEVCNTIRSYCHRALMCISQADMLGPQWGRLAKLYVAFQTSFSQPPVRNIGLLDETDGCLLSLSLSLSLSSW